MNPLNHFGIRNRIIRGDTSSYNMIVRDKVGNVSCSHCGKHLGVYKGSLQEESPEYIDNYVPYKLMEAHLPKCSGVKRGRPISHDEWNGNTRGI